MAQERISGLILRDDMLAWTVVLPRNRNKVVARHRVALNPPPAETAGDEPSSGGQSLADQVRAGCAGLKGSTVSVALPTDRLLLRVLDLPTTDASELGDMIALQVDKFSPFPIESMVVSHEVLKRGESSSLVLVAAARETEIDAAGELLREAGIAPRRVDAAAMGWWQVVRDSGKVPDSGRRVLILLDTGAPEMIVVQDGIPVLFRALSGAGAPDTREGAADLADEIAYALMSIELEHGGGAATTVQIGHVQAEPQFLRTALAERCDCAVEAFPLSELRGPAEGIARRATARVPALDLTPPAWREAEHSHEFRRRMIAAVAVIVATWLAALGVLLGGLAWHKVKLARLNTVVESWREPAAEVRRMRDRVFMIERYRQMKTSALECLREVSGAMPDGVLLTSFTYRKGDSVRISGEADAVGVVYAFKNKLDESDLFAASSLTGPRRDPRRRKEVFDVELELPGGEPE
jgi:hypothetical protein